MRASGVASILRKLTAPHNWRALSGMLRVSCAPLDLLRRQFLGGGTYPFTTVVRTPIGPVTLTLNSPSDIITLMEVFFRRDYDADATLRVAVDFGANIGIASAYFLSRGPTVRVYAYEPVPSNIAAAKRNLAQFGDRVVLSELAVADKPGKVQFGIEATGRYGGIGVETKRQIEVECCDAKAALADILVREKSIDILKVDVEGMERVILDRVATLPDGKIRLIYAEYFGDDVSLRGYRRGQYLSIARWELPAAE